jgi:hypothetical protein
MPAGSICTTDSQCVEGTWCDRLVGGDHCLPLCLSNDPSSGDTTCQDWSSGSICFALTGDAFVCSIPCDLFNPQNGNAPFLACNTGEDCKYISSIVNGACARAGDVAAGQPCTGDGFDECATGSTCLDTNVGTDAGVPNQICTPLCAAPSNPDAGASVPCTSGTCVVFTLQNGENAPNGLGFCRMN